MSSKISDEVKNVSTPEKLQKLSDNPKAPQKILGISNRVNESDIKNVKRKLFPDKENESTTHYGFWFQYLPFSDIQASGEFILNDKSGYTGQSIMANFNFSADVQSKKLYMWLSFESTILNIVLNDNGRVIKFAQDPLNFEGIWNYAYFQNQDEGSVLYMKGSQLWSAKLSTNDVVPILNQYGKLSSQNFDYFHGRYSQLEAFTISQFKDKYEFEQYFLENLHNPQTYNKTVLDVFDGIKILGDKFYQSQFLMLGYRYQIRCWVKVSYENVQERQRYLLMRMTLNENYRNDTYVGDRVLLMSYVLDSSSNNYNVFNVSVLQYTYPKPYSTLTAQSSTFFAIQNSTNRDRFQRWHYIYFQYLTERSYLKVVYPNDQELTQQFNSLQFHDQYIYLYVGADSFFYKSYLGGRVQLEITYNYQEELTYEIKCHYSCQTCIGPSESDCTLCPQDSNRLWKHGFCACQYGYIDLDQIKKCNKINELYPFVKEIYLNNTFRCKYGEFLIDNSCISCPSSFNDYQLNCADCLLNSSTWYKNPICTFDYKRYSLSQTFGKYIRNESQQEIFYINTQYLDLELCQGCLNYCNDVTKLTCILFNDQYFSCKQGYFVSGNICKKCKQNCQNCQNSQSCTECVQFYGYNGYECQQCPINCAICNSSSNCLTCQPQFALFKGKCYGCGSQCSICEFYYDEVRQTYINRCLKCIDPSLFEISFDALKCQPVTIKNCVYGISQYYFVDYPKTNIDLYFQPMVINSSITNICARCISGYTFSNSSSTCYKSSQQCQESGFYTGTSYTCLIGGDSALSLIGCEFKLQNCYQCVDYLNKVICLKCFLGYYADHIVGTCVLCPQQCLSCVQQFKKNKSDWKQNIRPFYEYFVNKKVNHDYVDFVESSNPDDFEIICTACSYGYEVYQDICINKCPIDCLECKIINNSKICISCSYSSNGLILSTNNNQCYQCHSQCKFCVPTSNTNFNQFANKCLIPLNENNLFDSNIYQFSSCLNNQACQMSMAISLNLICSKDYQTANSFDIPYNQESDLSFIFETLYSKGLFNYMNDQNVQTLNIYIKTQTCTFPQNLVIAQEFSNNVYTLKNVSLYILGLQANSTIQFSDKFYLKEFDALYINNLNINFPGKSITFNLNQDQFTIGFENVSFIGQGSILFEYNSLLQFSIINVNLDGFKFTNMESLLKVEPIKSIIIQNVKLLNLILHNSTLFKLQNVEHLVLDSITVESNYLYNSKLFEINQQQKIDKFIIKWTFLEVSSAFYGLDFQFSNLYILMNLLMNSSFICQSSQLQMENSIFEENYITQNSYLVYVIQNTKMSDIILDHICFSLNSAYYSSHFLYVQTLTLLHISNLELFLNPIEIDVNYAFQILSNSFILQDSVIEISNQISPIFEATNLELFSFDNVTMNQQYYLAGLSSTLDCLQVQDSKYPIFNLFNIQIVQFQFVNFTNIFTYNQPVIKIGSTKFDFNSLITIQNSIFQDLLIIKSTNNITVAFLVIESKNSISINITNSSFLNTIYKEYIGLNNYGTSANNFYFSVPQGSVYFDNNTFRSNLIIGSLNSNMYIWCMKFTISNCNFKDINVFNKLFYQVLSFKYQGLQYQEQLERDFRVKSYGGIAQIYVEEIQINNTYFEQYVGYKGGCMYIITLNNGIISIFNSQFKNGQAIIGQLESQGGSFVIDSKGSKLNLQIINCTIQNSLSFDRGGFAMITLSDQSTILFQNISMIDSHSLYSSILSLETNDFLQKQYTFEVRDCVIENTKLGQENYFKLIQLKDLIYLFTFDTYDSVLFEIQNGKTTFQNLIVQNIIGYGFMNNKQSHSVTIDTVHIFNFLIQKRPLMFFDRSVGPIIILNSHIHSVYQNYTKMICLYFEYQLEGIKQQCTYQPYTLSSQLNTYNKQCDKNVSISYDYQIYNIFQIIQTESEVQISSTVFSNLYCSNCNVFYIESNNRVVIQQTKFIKNIGNNSILNIHQIQQTRLLYSYQDDLSTNFIGQVLIKESQFIQNQGTYGGSIQAVGVSISCYSVLFQNNTAIYGGAIFLNKGNLEMTDSKIIDNIAIYGAGIYSTNPLSIQKDRGNVMLDNKESGMFGNMQSQPSKLALSLDTFQVFENKVIFKNASCIIEEVKQQIMLPNNVEIYNYQVLEENFTQYGLGNQLSFVSNSQVYHNLKYKFRLIPLNDYNERQYNLTDTYCKIRSRLASNKDQEFQVDYLSIDKVYFNTSTQDYYLDNLRILINEDIQIEVKCNSIKLPIYDNQDQHIIDYHDNYSIIINVQSFPCQRGEILDKQMCVKCQSQTYSLKQNSLKCSIGNEEMIESVISSNIEVKPFYWRPYYDNDEIYLCIISPDKCLGGWNAGPDSCLQGSFGALCETCDIYNIRGQGSFFKSNMDCFQCQDSSLAYLSLLVVGLWTLISMIISVNSSLDSLQLELLRSALQRGGLRSYSELQQSSSMYKMLFHYLQIISILTTFQLQFPNLMNIAVRSVGSPTKSLENSIDCFLMTQPLDILHSRIIWIVLAPLLYLSFVFTIYFLIIVSRKQHYRKSISAIILLQTFVTMQPSMIGVLISILGFREISGYNWVIGDVSYRYDKNFHFSSLLAIPILFGLFFLIPLSMFIVLHKNHKNLNKIKRTWGYLFSEFNENAYFWELIRLGIKNLVIIIITLFDQYIVLKATFVFLLIQGYQSLNKLYQPFKTKNLNQMEDFGSKALSISIVLGGSSYQMLQTVMKNYIYIFYVIILEVNCTFLYYIFSKIIEEQYNKNKNQINKIQNYFRTRFPFLTRLPFFKNILYQKQVKASYNKLKKVALRVKETNSSKKKQNFLDLQQDESVIQMQSPDLLLKSKDTKNAINCSGSAMLISDPRDSKLQNRMLSERQVLKSSSRVHFS